MHAISTNPASDKRALGANDSGAVLVVGLLFAIVSMGFIWGLFHIGDAMLRQEHGNGAADAAALSAAIQHARMMNVVVLFNLLASAILTVRVVLRALELAALILAIPTLGASLAAIPPLEAALMASMPGIMFGLQALEIGAQMMILSVPGVAQGTATYIAESYRPVVKQGVVTSGAQDPYAAVIGLPLQEDVWGSTQCRKTAVFMQDLLAYPLDYIGMGFLVRLVGKPIRKLLNNPASAAVMCGLGVNYELEVPGVDKLRDKIQADCREELKKENIDPTSPEGQQKFKLCTVKLEGPLTVAEGPISDVVNSAVEGIFGLTPPTTFSVAKEWKQGSPSWGILAIMTLEEDSLRKTEAASLAGFGKKSIGALPAVANRAVAQAEFYYDCNSKWEEEDCDGPTEPMWNFRWRARLTPVYPDSPTLQDMFKNLKPALDREFDAAGQTNLGKALKERKTFVVH